MVKWLFVSFLCEAALGGICLIWSFAIFDRIIRRLYSANRSEWERLGMPVGFFWVPPDMKRLSGKGLFGSSVARSSFFSSISKSANAIDGAVSGADCSSLRLAVLLGRVFFAASFVCFALALVCIFL